MSTWQVFTTLSQSLALTLNVLLHSTLNLESVPAYLPDVAEAGVPGGIPGTAPGSDVTGGLRVWESVL